MSKLKRDAQTKPKLTLVPTLIAEGNVRGEYHIDADIDPKYDYHVYMNLTELTEVLAIISKYKSVMARLEELKRGEIEPTWAD